MIYALEEGTNLRLVSYSDHGIIDLYSDTSCEALFAFAEADLEDCYDLVLEYIESMIDIENLRCLKDEDGYALSELYDLLTEVHPFFEHADPAFIWSDMLGATLNLLLSNKKVTEEKYYTLLFHLIKPVLSFSSGEVRETSIMNDEAQFAQRLYREYLHITNRDIYFNWEKRLFSSLTDLQKYTKLYLYWVLDASSSRFKGLDMVSRQKLFANIFGSINLWQPLTIKEVSCIGSPNSQSIGKLLFMGFRASMSSCHQHTYSELADEAEKDATDKPTEKRDSKDYLDMLYDINSDDADIAADLSDWLNAQIEASKKETSQPLFKAYEISSFSDYILLQLRILTEHNVIMKRCKNCEQYFITERPNIDYCQRILPGESQTCYVIGPKRVFNKNLAADLPRALYSKAYKRYQARLRRGVITEKEFEIWKSEAKTHLENVQHHLIPLTEYTNWMEGQNKDKEE